MKTPNNEYAREDPDDALFRSPRRAVYLPVLRSKVYDMFGIFDYSNPSIHLPQRPTTTVAHQALFLLNSPLVYEQARSLAERLLAVDAPTDRSRIDDLYLRLFSRPATRADRQRADRFLNRLMGMSDPETTSAERRIKAWTMLCQSLMAANEFVYLD